MIKPKAILDTCVLVDIIRGKRKDLDEKTAGLDIGNCAIADLTVFELLCGVEKSACKEKNRETVSKLLNYFPKRPVAAGFEYSAKEKCRLEKEGLSIEDIDLLIGCLCAAEGVPLVTSNSKHLSRIRGLDIIPW